MSTNAALPVPLSPATPAPGDRRRLQEAMASARSASTRRCYRSQWNLWRQWAAARGHEVMPAAPVAVADFLLDRAESGVSIATVQDGPLRPGRHAQGCGTPGPYR